MDPKMLAINLFHQISPFFEREIEIEIPFKNNLSLLFTNFTFSSGLKQG